MDKFIDNRPVWTFVIFITIVWMALRVIAIFE